MENKTLNIFLAIVAVFAFGLSALAQTQPTKTTLASAMLAGSNTMVVSSATGFTVTTNNVNNYVLVEKDLRRIQSISGTTITLFGANVGGLGVPAAHPSGATVIFGPQGNWQQSTGNANGVFLQSLPTGACTRSSQSFLPAFVIQSANPAMWKTVDCIATKPAGSREWVSGTLIDEAPGPPLSSICTVPVGSVAYGSMGTSITTGVTTSGTASIWVPNTSIFTSITALNGSAVDGASKKIYVLYDAAGAVLANTAVAGTLASGNDAFQSIALTATRIVLGPALYGISIQDDTTDTNGLRAIAASTFNNVVTSSPTTTFGTVAAITFPTTFTADLGPIACLVK